MKWQANSVRFVVFAPTGVNENAGQLFHALTGAFPQNMQQQGPVGGTAGGLVGEHWINFSTQPGRLQLDVTGKPNESGPPSILNDIPATCTLGMQYASKLVIGRLVNRIAIVVDAMKPATNADAARIELKKMLPFLDLPDGATEVSLQVNRSISAGTLPIEINRLCRWGTATLQMVQFEIANSPTSPRVMEIGHATTLLVDVNTSPRHEAPIEQVRIMPLYAELAEAALAVIDVGYDALR